MKAIARKYRNNHIALWILTCALNSGILAQEAGPTLSPVVLELTSAIRTRSAVEKFWQRIGNSKSPVIEGSNKPDHSWVTFFFRGDKSTERVQLNSAITAAETAGLVLEGSNLGTFKTIGDTDIYYYSLLLPNDLRITYRLNVTKNGEEKAIPDPLNPDTYRYPSGSGLSESILALPKAPPRPWREAKTEGKWQDIEITSKPLNAKTTVNIYLPKSWGEGTEKDWNMFIGMDGIGYRDPLIPADRIIEHLMSSKEIQPTILVLIGDFSELGDQSENGYDPVVSFLADELIPTISERIGVVTKPSQVVVSGKSRRGMMSAYAAFKRPDVIGKVLSLSGSYYWKKPGQTEYELIPRLYAEAEKKAVKLYLSAGIYEVFVSTRNAGHYLLATNRHMRNVLKARNYEFKYEEFPATHREINWEDQLVNGLRYLLPAFGQSKDTMTVKVFFHNEKFNPNAEDCNKVYPTTRTILKTKAVARGALDQLFKGTTEEERKNEFWSFPPEDTKDIIKSLNVRDGVAFLNFKKTVFEKLGNTTSSCGGGFYSSIEATLKQFPTVQKVVYAVESSTNDFYEWVQVGACPHPKRLCAASNFK